MKLWLPKKKPSRRFDALGMPFFKQDPLKLLKSLPKSKLPQHLAIIMDGNGRWAKRRGMPRTAGHAKGVSTIRNVVEWTRLLDIPYLSIYAFSTENWKRSSDEVGYLMNLLMESIQKELPNLIKNGVRLRALGERSAFSPKLLAAIESAEAQTAHNTQLNLNVMLGYGSRLEILSAVKNIVAAKTPAAQITEELLSQQLYTAGQPDPDLLIRTSGEFRISNFMLWQLAYTEIYITPVLWPDFSQKAFYDALVNFGHRERRFGHA